MTDKPKLDDLEGDFSSLTCMSSILNDIISDISDASETVPDFKKWRDRGYTVALMGEQEYENLIFASFKLGEMIGELKEKYYAALEGSSNATA